MKNSAYLFLLVFIWACGTEQKADHVLFSGKIENAKNDALRIMGGELEKTITLSEDGSFADTLQITEAGYYTFINSNESSVMYLKPGYSLELAMDTKLFDESIKYSGKGASNNNYLAKKYLDREQATINPKTLFSASEEEFVAGLDKLSNSILKDLEKVKDPEFIALEKKELKYDKLQHLDWYENAHQTFTGNDDFKVSDNFLKPLDDLQFNNEEDYKLFDVYKSLVQNHYTNYENAEQGIDLLLKEVKSDLIRKDLFQNYYYTVTTAEDKPIFDKLMASSTDEEFKSQLSEKFEKLKLVAKGLDSPKFAYQDINGKTVALEDLKGKQVYIDVWATWCGPCKAEIPHLKELEAEYHDKNIEFVSISIDNKKDFETWKRMVADKELKGIQLFADNDWNSEFVRDYAIEGIPRFILVDEEGKVVSASAPRPSDKKAVTVLFDKTEI